MQNSGAFDCYGSNPKQTPAHGTKRQILSTSLAPLVVHRPGRKLFPRPFSFAALAPADVVADARLSDPHGRPRQGRRHEIPPITSRTMEKIVTALGDAGTRSSEFYRLGRRSGYGGGRVVRPGRHALVNHLLALPVLVVEPLRPRLTQAPPQGHPRCQPDLRRDAHRIACCSA